MEDAIATVLEAVLLEEVFFCSLWLVLIYYLDSLVNIYFYFVSMKNVNFRSSLIVSVFFHLNIFLTPKRERVRGEG